MRAHLGIAKTNGVTETELEEVIIHLAFYAAASNASAPNGWVLGARA
jgi:alkylhydroperoxidase/carboxymuconolactone decarboxylase family protein YurZ